jgi:hypothetical protein
MTEPRRIADPSLLTDITTGLSSLNIEASEPQPTTLVLLQPLANASMLAACRPQTSSSKYEFLKIQPLSLAWRQAIIKIPPIPHIIFDLSLPKPPPPPSPSPGEVEFQKIYSDAAFPAKGGLGVLIRDVMMMVVTIATETRMRAEGKVKFEVVFDETENVAPAGLKLLEKQLSALEKEYNKIPKKQTTEKDDEREAEDGEEEIGD